MHFTFGASWSVTKKNKYKENSMSKKGLRFALSLGVVLLVVVIGSCSRSSGGGDSSSAAQAASGENVVFVAAHGNPETSPTHLAFLKMQELVHERFNRRYTIELYGGGSLGAERDLIEGMALGTVDMVNSNCSVVSNFVPEYFFADIPFLFSSYDHLDKVMAEGTVKKYLDDGCYAAGYIPLGIWENGFRHMFYNGKAIKAPADINGQKFRTQENTMHLEFWRMLGVSPISMNGPDALSAIQQGAIDGMEYPLSLAGVQGVYEMANNMTYTYHIYTMAPTIMLPNKFELMSKEEQQTLIQIGDETALYARRIQREQEADALKKVTEHGNNIYETDITAFITKLAPFYEKYDKQYGELVAVVRKLAAK
jgi:tripartite ATP-independent transporter DctP family solute receptor